MLKTIPVQESVGTVLCHDITRIVRGEFKGRAFKKGHVVRADDIPLLLEIGKERLYVISLDHGWLHENEAARRISRAVSGENITFSGISEGRINMQAACDGLLRIDTDALERVNALDGLALATLHTNQEVSAGAAVAGTRIIPLVIEEERIRAVEEICTAAGPVVRVVPFPSWRVGVVTTGSEVYEGRIKDTFGPIVKAKFEELGSTVVDQVLVSDNREMTV